MKALLIGGTGTISGYVTRQLIQDGWEVFLLNRGNKPLPQGAVSIIGDIKDEEAVKTLLEGRRFDMVADFIAFTPEDIERDVRLFAGITGQYIFISSASAYQKPPGGVPITESTPLFNPYWQYSRDKIACEDALMAHYRNSGFPATIVRPSHTYNEVRVPMAVKGTKGSWQNMQRMQQGKPVLLHGDGTSLWPLTHSRDFARAFAGLCANPRAIGHAVHITTDEAPTWNQVYGLVAGFLGVPLRVVYVPSVLLAAAGRAHGYNYEGELLGDKANSLCFDNSKIKQLVPGWQATTRVDQGVREAVTHLLASPELQQPDPEFDAFTEKMCVLMESAWQQALAPSPTPADE